MPPIPNLTLTHGQVAWSLCNGQKPDQRTLDSLRYLRQLGVPFTEDELGGGRGNRLTYKFEHLVECAVAMYAIHRGMRPRVGAGFLVADRTALRQMYKETFIACPEEAISAPWIKNPSKGTPITSDELYIRLHARYADTSGHTELMTMEEVFTFKGGLGDMVDRYSDGVFPLVPLKRVMLEAVAWAMEAPVTPPGRVVLKN